MWIKVCRYDALRQTVKTTNHDKLDFSHIGFAQHTHTHARRKGVCSPSRHHWHDVITLNVLKCRTAKGEQNQSLCLSWPCLRLGRTAAWGITQENLPLCTQQAALMCKCMQEDFRKAEITEPNEGAALKLLGLWIITANFLELSLIYFETMASVV